MTERIQIEYTYYPRRHADEIPQNSYQGLIHEIEQVGGTLTAYAAIGELTHRRLTKRAIEQDLIGSYPEFTLPPSYAFPRAVVVAIWPKQTDYDHAAFAIAGTTGEERRGVDRLTTDELMRKLGLGLLAAVRSSLNNEPVRGETKYTDQVTAEDWAAAEAAERLQLAFIHS